MLPSPAGRAALGAASRTWLRLPSLLVHRRPDRAAAAALATAAPLSARPPPRAQARRPAPSVACRSYASPEVYDIAFSFRDFEAEAAFLMQAYAQHCGGAPLASFLDVGCGPARHAVLLASAAGVQAVGLDSSPGMVAYAAQRAQAAGVGASVAVVCADMAAPAGFLAAMPGARRVDLAAAMLGTLAHCLDNDAALRCFHNLAEAVRPGGLLVLELPHPDELFDGSLQDPDSFVDCWEAAERADGGGSALVEPPSDSESDASGNEEDSSAASAEAASGSGDEGEGAGARRVLVEYGREGDAFDPGTQVLGRTVGLSLFDPEGNLVSSATEVVPQRQFGLQEVDLLARAAGFRVASVHGDVDLGVGLEAEGAYRMVVCLLRKEGQA